MNNWQATFLGLKQLPRELSGFEIEAFFTFTASERALIEARRGPSLKLGLALQIGFLRMSGRVLDAVRIVPPTLWKHLGSQFGEKFHRVARFPVRRVFLEPLARDRLEGIRGGIEGHEFLVFARGAGIDAIGDQLAHLVATVARLLQSDVRVHAERNPLLLAGEAILETLPTAAGRRDLQIQAAAVEQADGFLLSRSILNFRG
jgi:Domain of unknown function (DUF4158)